MNRAIVNNIDISYNKIINLKNKYNIKDEEKQLFDIKPYNDRINNLQKEVKKYE